MYSINFMFIFLMLVIYSRSSDFQAKTLFFVCICKFKVNRNKYSVHSPGLVWGRAVCFFEAKFHEVCGPPLQSSVAEEVEQTAAVHNKNMFVF